VAADRGSLDSPPMDVNRGIRASTDLSTATDVEKRLFFTAVALPIRVISDTWLSTDPVVSVFSAIDFSRIRAQAFDLERLSHETGR
jgi:hypothetical protein